MQPPVCHTLQYKRLKIQSLFKFNVGEIYAEHIAKKCMFTIMFVILIFINLNKLNTLNSEHTEHILNPFWILARNENKICWKNGKCFVGKTLRIYFLCVYFLYFIHAFIHFIAVGPSLARIPSEAKTHFSLHISSSFSWVLCVHCAVMCSTERKFLSCRCSF